ncbi:MAG: GMC family oxidoreductase [Deltaproteobacteria bacterium]|nr:GMC family oxidoreductase [Deltaproteobacteria bacterium]
MNQPDVVVIGSGFGGSITAARLAQRGMRVLILERGPWWGPAGIERSESEHRREFPRTLNGLRKSLRNIRWARGGRSRELLLNPDGLYEYHGFRHLDVVTGSGVGGGSLIYTSIMEQPEDDFFDAFPAEITPAEMQPYFGRVREMLRPRPMPDRPEKNAVFEQMVRSSGVGEVKYPDVAIQWRQSPDDAASTHNAAGVKQAGCTHCGMCVAGCNERAKTTMDLTYLPAALAAGAVIRPMSEVMAIGEVGQGYFVRYLDRITGQELTVNAHRVVLAAGSLNTLRLLFTCRDRLGTLPRLPESLGSHFSPNTDMGGLVYRTPKVTNSAYGAAFNSFVPVRKNGRYRFLVGEVGMPTAEFKVPGFLKKRVEQSLLLLGMGRDASTGTVRFDGKGLVTDMGRSVDPEIFAEMETVMGEIARQYEPARSAVNIPSGRGSERIFTVHPLGGASIASTPAEGATDHRGQIFGHPGLHVADGSLYPKAPGIPPSFTIAALAERIAALMD